MYEPKIINEPIALTEEQQKKVERNAEIRRNFLKSTGEAWRRQEKKDKFNNFLTLAIGLPIVLSLGVGLVNEVNASNEKFKKEETHLKNIAQNPIVHEVSNVNDCNISYVETAHKESTPFLISGNVDIYKPDFYIQTDCNGVKSSVKVQSSIQEVRASLLKDNNDLSKQIKNK